MIDFGFDLAEQSEPRIVRGAVLGAIGATLEAGVVVLALVLLDVALSDAGLDAIPLLPASLGFACLLACAWLVQSAAMVDNFTGTYRLVRGMRLRVLEHLRQLPLGFWKDRHSGPLASALTDQFSQYTEIVTHVWGLVVANTARPLVLGATLWVLDWRLGLLATLPIPIALLVIPWAYRLLDRSHARLSAVRDPVLAQLTEALEGAVTLLGFGAWARTRVQLHEALLRLEAQQMRSEVMPAPALLSFGLLIYAGFALAMIGGAWLASVGMISGGRLVTCLTLALFMARALADLALYLTEARHAVRTLRRIRAITDSPVQPDASASLRLPDAAIAVEDVSFAFGERTVLTDVTAGFLPGTVTALVGPSGSGKSTLAHLLTRLWDVDVGSIELGGENIQEMPLTQLHENVATVFQDVVLFRASILENIRLGDPSASRARVEDAARAANAHAFITSLPDGYDTMLGPGGSGLSGGQRQRISIARAILRDAPVLVLDEATASIDPDTEHLVQEALGRLMTDRTVIVVAHRLWTVTTADQLLVLDEGRVVQRGRHDHLVDEPGLYRRLWRAEQARSSWTLAHAPRSVSR